MCAAASRPRPAARASRSCAASSNRSGGAGGSRHISRLPPAYLTLDYPPTSSSILTRTFKGFGASPNVMPRLYLPPFDLTLCEELRKSSS
jgi:hypothetical protein